ncbi:MAG: FemAB family protein, partial [Winogradskyella sp.]|nr:FemAB family protein [Winogradskyella sp.]
RLIAVFPANIKNNTLYSHQGLTYGGFVVEQSLNATDVEPVINAFLDYLKTTDVQELHLKGLPGFYHSEISKAIETCINTKATELYRTDKVLAIDYNKPIDIHKTKRKHFRRHQETGFKIEETQDFTMFWENILVPRLNEKHGVKPVHSLKEIMLLKKRFPQQIKQYNILLNKTILAGITIFDKGRIVKSQYGATTETGEQMRALEYLFITLINKYKAEGKSFFSMGIVRDEEHPKGYNEGLLRQKQELGCKEFHQHFYKLKISG